MSYVTQTLLSLNGIGQGQNADDRNNTGVYNNKHNKNDALHDPLTLNLNI